MTEPARTGQFPRRILLALDLSSRGDRALDRTVQLAREWAAEVHVVHALESPPGAIPVGVDAASYLRDRPDPGVEAGRQLTRLVGGAIDHVHVEEGTAAQVILSAAQREGCDLIVLGEGRDRLVGPLESTLDEVVRKARVSVLVVRNRPAGPYGQVLVGTDYTDEAAQALARSAQWFPAAQVTLLHAYVMPYSGLLGNAPSDEDWSDRQRASLRAHLEDSGLPVEKRRSIRLRVEPGPPAAVLKRYLQEGSTDLTVIGAHPRGMLFDAVVGSSRLIVDAVPGDVLVVRAVRRPAQ